MSIDKHKYNMDFMSMLYFQNERFGKYEKSKTYHINSIYFINYI